MKIKYILLSLILVLLLAGCTKETTEQDQITQPNSDIYPNEIETLLITLQKINPDNELILKYEIYNNGKYIITNSNGTKESKLSKNDLSYLKSLVNTREYKAVPNYMSGSGENCPTYVVRLEDQGTVKRSETCAVTPTTFNLVVDSIEKLN